MPETTILGFRRGAPRRLLVVLGPKGDQGDQGEIGPPGTTDYNYLTNKPALGTAAAHAATDFASPADVANEVIARNNAIAAAIANLLNSAPGALDTLKELADALGDDPNFATTITNLITAETAARTTGDANTLAGAESYAAARAVAMSIALGG